MRSPARALTPWLPATLALALALVLPFGASTRAQKPAADAPKAEGGDDDEAEVGAPTVLDRVRDEIELLQVQLEIKKAHANVTKVRLEQARMMQDIQDRLRQTGTTGPDKFRQAQAEVAVLEAQYVAEQAEFKEPEVRLKHARQHLAALQKHPELTRPMNPLGMLGMMRPGGGQMLGGPGGAGMMAGGMMGGPGGGAGEQIRVLDKKVDRLIEAVEELREEVKGLKKEKE
jgi:hypothetical protein